MRNIILISLFVMLGVACTPENKTLMSKPDTSTKVVGDQEFVSGKSVFNNKVDVLFVIDNSGSMTEHIEKLRTNIKYFVEAFQSKNKTLDIDFRIGVTTVWDSKKYDKEMKAVGINKPFFEGQLRPVAGSNLPYITSKTKDYTKALESLLQIEPEDYRCVISQSNYDKRYKGKKAYHTADTFKALDQESKSKYLSEFHISKAIFETFSSDEKKVFLQTHCGPENEEVFSPLVKIINDSSIISKNGNFPSSKANQLAVIVITDAEDDVEGLSNNGSGFNPEDVAFRLNSFMKDLSGDKISAFGVLNHQCSESKTDPGTLYDANGNISETTYAKADNIKKMIDKLGGKTLDICSGSYGDKLAQFGRIIKEKTFERKDITLELGYIPAKGTLEIKFGSQKIPYDKDNTGNGWKYGRDNSEVIIGTKTPLDFSKASKLSWSFEIAKLSNVKNGRLKTTK